MASRISEHHLLLSLNLSSYGYPGIRLKDSFEKRKGIEIDV